MPEMRCNDWRLSSLSRLCLQAHFLPENRYCSRPVMSSSHKVRQIHSAKWRSASWRPAWESLGSRSESAKEYEAGLSWGVSEAFLERGLCSGHRLIENVFSWWFLPVFFPQRSKIKSVMASRRVYSPDVWGLNKSAASQRFLVNNTGESIGLLPINSKSE